MENEKIIPEIDAETTENTDVATESEAQEVPEAVDEKVVEPKPAGYCTKCGTPYKEGQSFCANCGAPLNASVPAQPVAAAPVNPATPPTPGQYIVQQPSSKPAKKKKSPVVKIVIAVVIAFLVGFIAVSGLEEDDVVGMWSGSYSYNGNSYSVAFELKENGRYSKATFKNGRMHDFEVGDWDVKGGSVYLYDDSSVTYHGSYMKYSYFFGQLGNNSHYFSRSEKN